MRREAFRSASTFMHVMMPKQAALQSVSLRLASPKGLGVLSRSVLLHRPSSAPFSSRTRIVAWAGPLPAQVLPHNNGVSLQHQEPTTVLLQAATVGRVELIMGPMFAGKTTALIRHARQAQAQGRAVLVLTSNKDKRYAACHLATHDGDRLPCTPLGQLLHVEPAQLQAADVIAIDEAQFFPDLIEFVKWAADDLQKTVIVAGLDGDFKRQRFGQILDLVPLADHVHKVHSRCFMDKCTQPAIFSMRMTAHQEQEVVGGSDMYVAACRGHYVQPTTDA